MGRKKARWEDVRTDISNNGSDKISVLYVDDEPALLHLSKEFLEMEEDIHVDTSTSVHQALDALSSQKYEVIISDYKMPQQSGIDFLKLLREGKNSTPFVLFTGRGREEVAIEALNHGADFYLQKGGDPFTQFGELRNIILQLAHRGRAEASLREREELLSLITNNMRDVVAKVRRDGIIQYVSPSIELMTGHAIGEVLNHGILEFVHPQDVPDMLLVIRQTIEQKVGMTVEFRLRRKDGTFVWMEGTGNHLYDEEGGIHSTVLSMRSIEDRRRFEESIRHSERKYRELIENSDVIVLRLDSYGHITYMNEFALRFFDYTLEEVFGRRAAEVIFPREEEGADQGLRAMVREMIDQPGYYASRIEQNVRRNGERVWVAWANRHVKENGDSPEILCMGVDITEHHYSEEKLGESIALLKSVLDSTLDALLVTDLNDVVRTYNRRVLSIFDIPDEMMEGATLQEIWQFVMPQLRDPEAFRKSVLRFKEGMVAEQEPVVLKSGHQYTLSIYPHRMGSEIIGIVWGFHDITEQVRAQEALAERESRFRAIFDNTALGIGLIDEKGIIVEANDALHRTLGYTRGELRGCHRLDCGHPEDTADEMALYEAMMSGEIDHYVMERRFITRDGRIIWARVTSAAVRDGKGQLRFGLEFVQDITEQKNVQERLRLSEERYRLLASNFPNGIVMLFDRDLRYTLVEGRGMGEAGLSKNLIEGHTPRDIFPTEVCEQVEEGLRRTLRGETVIQIIHWRGRVHRAFNTPLISEGGEVYGGMTMTQDITDLERSEEELRRLNRSLRILSDGTQSQVRARDEYDMYRRACEALVDRGGHDLAYVELLDEHERPRLVAIYGRGTDRVCHLPPLSGDRTLYGTLVVGDLANRPPTPADDILLREGFRSFISLPLWHHGQPIGALRAFSSKVDAFDDSEVALLSELADDLAIGIASFRERAQRLHSENILARRGQQLERLTWSTQTINLVLEQKAILRTLVDSAMDLVDCEAGMVGWVREGRMVYDEINRRGTLVPIKIDFAPGEEGPGQVMQSLQSYISNHPEAGSLGDISEILDARNLAIIPLIDLEGDLIGTLWMQNKQAGDFSQWDVSLLRSLSMSTAVALANAETVQRLREREDELEHVNHKLDLIERITRHDLLNQLTALFGFLELGRHEEGERGRIFIDKALTSASNIANHLAFAQDYQELGASRPEWVPLEVAVQRGASTVVLGGVRLNVRTDGVEVFADRMLEKVFHNLLDNSIRHGGGVTMIDIWVQECPHGLLILYADDGKGIPLERKEFIFEMSPDHHGLHMVREVLGLTGIGVREIGMPDEGACFEMSVPRGGYRRSEQG